MTWSHNIAAKTEREVLALERIADALEDLVTFHTAPMTIGPAEVVMPDDPDATIHMSKILESLKGDDFPTAYVEKRSGIKTRRTKQRRKRGCRRLAKPVEINETEEMGNGKRKGAKDRRISGERRDNHGPRRGNK